MTESAPLFKNPSLDISIDASFFFIYTEKEYMRKFLQKNRHERKVAILCIRL